MTWAGNGSTPSGVGGTGLARRLCPPPPSPPRPAAGRPAPNGRLADELQPATLASYVEAIDRVIGVMCAGLDEPPTLDALAEQACLSRFHFQRVFRLVAGIPPGRFLTALRIHEAKRLLLTTSMSVLDVCTTVGYMSLGTFTTRFRQLVGTSPGSMRRLADRLRDDPLAHYLTPDGAGTLRAAVAGTIVGPRPPHVLIGLFAPGLPQGPPAACTVAAPSGRFALADVPDGVYGLFAWGFGPDTTVRQGLVEDEGAELFVGLADTPVLVAGSDGPRDVLVGLHRRQRTEPPVLSALPLLLMRTAEARPRTAEKATQK